VGVEGLEAFDPLIKRTHAGTGMSQIRTPH
jgi:hypothetical protein